MYNSSFASGAVNTVSDNRVFLYEVVSLRQNGETDKLDYPICRSGSVFITVPYNRMNQEMQRIARTGGKIVSIRPLSLNSQADSKVIPKSEPQSTQTEAANKSKPQAEARSIQIETANKSKPQAKSRPEPLAFLGQLFTGDTKQV